MLSPPDSPLGPVRLLQRVAANTGRTPPADLVVQVYAWIELAAVPILDGTPPAEALKLAARPGAWSRVPHRAARYAQRNHGLVLLDSLATGSQQARAEKSLEWLAAHRDGYPVPTEATSALDEVLTAGLPVPTDAGTVARIVSARAAVAHAAIASGDSERVCSESPPVAVIE